MIRLDDRVLLDLWERGADRAPVDRALLLLAAAAPDVDPAQLADVAIAERDHRVFGLRRSLFGNHLSGTADCPACHEPLEFHLDGATLESSAMPVGKIIETSSGLRFRLPNSRDLAFAIRAVGDNDGSGAARHLVVRCCLNATSDTAWTEALLAEAETVLDTLAEEAGLQLGFQCESCSAQWSIPFDVCAWLWVEIDRQARVILDDVHQLACAYGWSETAILGLSSMRRNAYLERCLA